MWVIKWWWTDIWLNLNIPMRIQFNSPFLKCGYAKTSNHDSVHTSNSEDIHKWLHSNEVKMMKWIFFANAACANKCTSFKLLLVNENFPAEKSKCQSQKKTESLCSCCFRLFFSSRALNDVDDCWWYPIVAMTVKISKRKNCEIWMNAHISSWCTF